MCVQIEDRGFSPTEVFRLVTTATLLTSRASQTILGNETVAKAFRSPPDGIVDAVVDAINARMSSPELTQIPATSAGIPEGGVRDSEGQPLNPACIVICDAGFGTGVQGNETRVSIDSSPKCTSCSEGYSSIGGKAAKCLPCLPGPPLLACLLPIKTPTAGSAPNWLCLCK